MSLTDLAQHAEDELMRRRSQQAPAGGGAPVAPQPPLGHGRLDRATCLRSQSHSPTLHRRAATRPDGPAPVQDPRPDPQDKARLKPKLMQLSLPLAACEEGKWRIIRDKDQWRSFYTTRGLVPKEPLPGSTATPRQGRAGPDARPPREPGRDPSQGRPVRPAATDPRRAASVPAPRGRAAQAAPPAIVVEIPAIPFTDPFSPRQAQARPPFATPAPDEQEP